VTGETHSTDFPIDDAYQNSFGGGELERLEIRLFPERTVRLDKLYKGYQLIGERLRPLPIGSTLDTQKGIFSWYPGPGYFGEYWFVFIETDPMGI
jgi:hypothetical protein